MCQHTDLLNYPFKKNPAFMDRILLLHFMKL